MSDIYVNVQHTDTFNTVTLNLTLVTQTGNDDCSISNIPQGTVSTTAANGTSIRLINAEQNNIAGTTILFVRIPAAAGTTPLAKAVRAAEILTASTVSGISVTARAYGTDNNAFLEIKPRNTTVNWSGVTESGSEWECSLEETTLDEVSYKIYPDPREIIVTAAGVITATDSNGTTIPHSVTGDILSVKKTGNIYMTNDEDALPSYTK